MLSCAHVVVCACCRVRCDSAYAVFHEAQVFVKAEEYLLPSQSLEMAANIPGFHEVQVFVQVPIRQGQFL